MFHLQQTYFISGKYQIIVPKMPLNVPLSCGRDLDICTSLHFFNLTKYSSLESNLENKSSSVCVGLVQVALGEPSAAG